MPAGVELAGDGLVANDRPSDELREQGNIEGDVDRVAVGPESPPVDVDDVGQAMEGEEGDSERKRDVGLRYRQSERRHHRREIAGDKIRVFEDRKDDEIAGDGDGERDPARRAVPVVDDQRGEEVEDDRENKDQDEARFTPGIEKEREQKRDDVLALDRRGQEVTSQEDGQEIEQERYRGKDHYRNACAELPDTYPAPGKDAIPASRSGLPRPAELLGAHPRRPVGAPPGTGRRKGESRSLRRFGGDVQARTLALVRVRGAAPGWLRSQRPHNNVE